MMMARVGGRVYRGREALWANPYTSVPAPSQRAMLVSWTLVFQFVAFGCENVLGTYFPTTGLIVSSTLLMDIK
ncbi:hypothetical protein OPV22_034037 [Ensete ventricosum]|uniref:Uncharacterized protein n=1 Tax=Ensete ventricosum TaxID=4639 RepID=A0AAV8P1F1_ENSVE|nr:hypothetical protein OPV22_034037 [Ensete ventricosum]